MPKHPVPKKKTSRGRSTRRYKSFQGRAQKRLSNDLQLTECSNCSNLRKMHTVCADCGHYRDKVFKDVEKEREKITKISA